VTAAALVFVVAAAVFGLASVLAEHAVAAASDFDLIVVLRGPVGTPVVFVVAAADRVAAVVFALVLAAVFVLVAFLADRAFVLPAHQPLC
jgi:hypothetical protein